MEIPTGTTTENLNAQKALLKQQLQEQEVGSKEWKNILYKLKDVHEQIQDIPTPVVPKVSPPSMTYAQKKEEIKRASPVVKSLAQGVVEAGCIVTIDGVTKPSKTGDFVYQMSSTEAAIRQQQIDAILSFTSIGWREMLQVNIGGYPVSTWLGLSQDEITLATDLHPCSSSASYVGIDIIGGKINDLNTDRATIAGFQPEFIEVFSSQYPDSTFKSFYDPFIQAVQSTGIDSSRTFVLTYPREVYAVPLGNFAGKFGFQIGSISEFDPDKYDLVIRQIKSQHMFQNYERYQAFLDAASQGLVVINPIGTYIAGHKGWPTIMMGQSIFPHEWFPQSWLINPSLGLILSSTGEIYLIEDGMERFLKHQDGSWKEFVFKPCFGAGGRTIYLGKYHRFGKWQTKLEQALESGEPFVIEQYQEPDIIPDVVVGKGNYITNPDALSVVMRSLSIIERIYGVSIDPDSTPFTAEVFGAQPHLTQGKINAAGYTFPVSFGTNE